VEWTGEAASSRLPLPLVVRGLVRRYGDLVGLGGIDLVMARDEILGLVGPNGSGKTTLLHVVAGLSRADEGRVVVCGHDAGSREARASLSFVPDEPAGFDELTVREFGALVGALYDIGDAWRERFDTIVRAFGLEPRLDTRLGALSRGLRRQATIVVAFAVGRPLTLIDEATATLDPEAVVVLRSLVRANARHGGATVLATQDLAFAERACDCVVLLDRGVVVEVGAPGEICARYGRDRLEEAFLEAVGRRDLVPETEHALAAL
jgi:ABC-type multidrug transport system ATPase subunit